jgi:dihydrofolate reductase
MGKVFVSMGMSLDGCIEPPGADLNTLGGEKAWGELHRWVFRQKFFRANLKLGPGGETGQDNQILEATFRRTGASIMGKRMFRAGEVGWPEEAPFHTDVFVLTHEARSPWERPGGTTFHFVTDGIESALRRARQAAGDRDVRIAGGADAVRQYLDAGLVDEIAIALSPVLLGPGRRLFEGVDAGNIQLELAEAIPSPLVTHLRYVVSRRS